MCQCLYLDRLISIYGIPPSAGFRMRACTKSFIVAFSIIFSILVQPKYRTRIGFVCTRRFPMLPADKSNGNSLSGRSVYSSNPTFCNGRIVLLSFLYSAVFFGCFLCDKILYGYILISFCERVNFVPAFCAHIRVYCLGGRLNVVFNAVFLFAHIKTTLVLGPTNARSMRPIPFPTAGIHPIVPVCEK